MFKTDLVKKILQHHCVVFTCVVFTYYVQVNGLVGHYLRGVNFKKTSSGNPTTSAHRHCLDLVNQQ